MPFLFVVSSTDSAGVWNILFITIIHVFWTRLIPRWCSIKTRDSHCEAFHGDTVYLCQVVLWKWEQENHMFGPVSVLLGYTLWLAVSDVGSHSYFNIQVDCSLLL